MVLPHCSWVGGGAQNDITNSTTTTTFWLSTTLFPSPSYFLRKVCPRRRNRLVPHTPHTHTYIELVRVRFKIKKWRFPTSADFSQSIPPFHSDITPPSPFSSRNISCFHTISLFLFHTSINTNPNSLAPCPFQIHEEEECYSEAARQCR